MNQVLNGIKVIKFYAWERPFIKIISNIRSIEIGILKKIAYLNVISSFSWIIAPFLVSLRVVKFFFEGLLYFFLLKVSAVSFGMFILINRNNVLNAEKAFVSLSLFNALKQPLTMLPTTISNIIQVKIFSSTHVKHKL